VGEFLQSYYLLRFEVTNLKRILRGKISGYTEERTKASLIPMKPFGVKSYDALVGASSVENILASLKGSQYHALSEQAEAYKAEQSIQPLERALDDIYARTILAAVKKLPAGDRKLVERIVQTEYDVENFLYAVKVAKTRKEDQAPPEFKAVHGIPKATLSSVASGGSLEEAVAGLREPFRSILKPIYEGDVALLRTNLRLQIYRDATGAKAGNSFGFNAVLAYLVYCELEKDDLVGIAWAKEQNVPFDLFFKYLVTPLRN
jgi:vacuolar-type H+-ATPase subunit C/Vma6